MPIDGITGVILAGGRSTRFGSNKALAKLDGLPLIKHTAVMLEKLFTERLLVTNAPEIYEFLGWPMTGDHYPGAGPLAGIQAALQAMRTDRAFVVACDMPLLPARLIKYLCGFPEEWDVVLPHPARGPEPLSAVYHRRILSHLEDCLRLGERKIGLALASLRVRRVAEQELLRVLPDLSAFLNINRPEDLRALLLNRNR